MSDLYPDDKMQNLVETLAGVSAKDVEIIDAVLKTHPNDPRLHFLKGSCLAGDGRLIEAHAALSTAVEIAPDFAIARFQLGFFQLTSGESDNAMRTWARLDGLPKEHYLRSFVIGLRHLIRDEFADCITMLEKGIAANDENSPLNNDMQIIIEQVRPLMTDELVGETDSVVALTSEGTSPDEADEEGASVTSFILNAQGKDETQH